MRIACQVVLTEEQERILWQCAASFAACPASRARTRRLVGGSRLTRFADRRGGRYQQSESSPSSKAFSQAGVAGLEKDAPRPGRTPTLTQAIVREVVRKTTQDKPANATRWSTRTMAETSGLSEKSVRRIWHKHGLKPHSFRTFKVSNDPAFA